MDFYVIPPLSNLELMNKGDSYFCLAQLYHKHAHYREFFKQKVKEGKWVTLDNGAGDHDVVTPNQLLNITLNLVPSEVIPPDYLFDAYKTIREFHPFIQALSLEGLLKKVQILACPQGKTESDWLFCYKYFLEHPVVSTIGFSKIAIPYAFFKTSKPDTLISESRNYVYHKLKASNLIQKPIHCLGMGDPREFEYYKGDPLMRSTDSCNTVWSGMNAIEFKEGNFTRIPTPKDYFDREISPYNLTLAEENIEYMRSIVNS